MAASSPSSLAPLRAVFMGTPAFAAVILKKILACPAVNVVAVYCRPDRPAGRGKALKAPEVKVTALQHGLPVEQPVDFKQPETVAALAAYRPDVLLVAAYGLILPQAVLDIPRLMPVNVHASLLPRYRGAAPIQRAVMNGDTVTGVTIMRMEAGLDTGPMLLQRAVAIDINDTAATLHDELAEEGGNLLAQALLGLQAGTVAPIPQDDSRATYASKLLKQESLLDLRLSASALHARVRGLTPWPGACLRLWRPGSPVLSLQVSPGIFPLSADRLEQSGCADPGAASPGAILGVVDGALVVACGEGEAYAFSALCPAGKKSMSGQAFVNGYLAATQSSAKSSPESPQQAPYFLPPEG